LPKETPHPITPSSTILIDDLKEMIKVEKISLLQGDDASSFKSHTLEGALSPVIRSEITGDTTLAFEGYPCQAK
jgi:hypothetical protein